MMGGSSKTKTGVKKKKRPNRKKKKENVQLAALIFLSSYHLWSNTQHVRKDCTFFSFFSVYWVFFLCSQLSAEKPPILSCLPPSCCVTT